MGIKAKVKELVADLVAGFDVPSASQRLSTTGTKGVDAILDAMEGKGCPAPVGRHPRDLDDDLSFGLCAIARISPEHLLTALDRRPAHAFSLIWALGSSREDAAVQKLTEYAKHNDKWVRWAAISGLARLHRKSLRQPLLVALRDRSEMVRFASLEGLVKVADHTAINPLKLYLAHKTLLPGAKRIASELLQRLEATPRAGRQPSKRGNC